MTSVKPARGRGGIAALLLMLAAGLGLVLILVRPPTAQFVAGGTLGSTEVSGQTFPKCLLDPLGQGHTLSAPPQRIVSGILAGDEMLAELVKPARLVGVTHLADAPGISNVAGHYPKSIARIQAEVETMLALRPDLVLVSTHTNAITVRLLMRAGVAVARFAAFDSFAQIADNIHTLGEIVGAPARAAAVVANMQSRLTAIQQQVAGRPRPRVLYYSLSGNTGGPGSRYYSLSGNTGGPGSLTDEMVQLAGGYNVIRDTGITGYRRITPELAITLQPEVILMSGWSGGEGEATTKLLREDPAWQRVPAIQRNRVYALRGGWVTSGSQFRVAGVAAVAELLHPEAFDDSPS